MEFRRLGGYKTVEFAGFYGIPTVEIKKALDDFGLLGVSIDYSLTIKGQ